MNDSKPKTVTVKAKSDPEALLNDLSSSMKSFQSTVRNWTANNSGNLSSSSSTSTMATPEMRPARLGLGAKAERKVASSDSVAGNLALKKQLTGVNSKNEVNNRPVYKVQKPQQSTQKQRRDDEESGGRASMISSKKRTTRN